MMPWMKLCVLGVLFTSAPALAEPASMPTKPSFSCPASDASCLRRMVFWYDAALEKTADVVAAQERQLGILWKQNQALTDSSDALADGLKRTSELAARAGTIPWWASPTLWLGVGFFLGAGAAVGIAAATARATK
jgi:hypothetical protein